MPVPDALAAALADRYRIERELGAGGMATVFLAEDLKHDRKVALKVLKPELAAVIGAERFLAEIKTTANLQHPHILPLFDSGVADGFLYYVMPLVEGETLRDRLAREKQLPVADAVRIAGEVASALDYAHRHGVIHRDIKPENILLHDGSALVADFGIALAASKAGGARMTETGMSLGTPQYMSPEQAMGEREITPRSDVYALGCVTYEMLLGEPPFTGPTAQSVVAKILSEKPAGLTARRDRVSAVVEEAVLTALEKLPADRFATAAQFAEALKGEGAPTVARTGASRAARRRSSLGWAAAAAALLVAAGAYLAGRGTGATAGFDRVVIRQRTYRTEIIFTARYTHGADMIVYSATEGGTAPRLYAVGSGYPEPRELAAAGTQLLSISQRDEMAVLVGAKLAAHRVFTGTLARMLVGGGAPREIMANVRDADWSPDGTELAIIHEVGGKDLLEYPIGTVLYRSSGYLSDVRIAPDGQHVAIHEHPSRWDDRGFVALVDRSGGHRPLTGDYWGLEGLVWTGDGRRLLFSAADVGGFYQVHEVTLDGRARLSLPSVGSVTIQDIAADGRWLLTRDDLFNRLMAKAPGATAERDLSWLDGSLDATITADGTLLAFSDVSYLGGSTYGSMVRRTDGSPAVRLGEGSPRDISRDKQWVLSNVPTSPMKLMLYPVGPGVARRVDHGELESYVTARFFADGRRIMVCGNEPLLAVRCYVRLLEGGALKAITPPGMSGGVLSPDGRSLVAASADSGYRIFNVDDGSSGAVPGLRAEDEVLRFSPDGRALWVLGAYALPPVVERLDLVTGRRSTLLAIPIGPRPGLLRVRDVELADDARAYAYVARETISHIFDVQGMK